MTDANDRRPDETTPHTREPYGPAPEQRDEPETGTAALWSRPGEDPWARDRQDPRPERAEQQPYAAPGAGQEHYGSGAGQEHFAPGAGQEGPGLGGAGLGGTGLGGAGTGYPGGPGGPPPAPGPPGGGGWPRDQRTDTLGMPVRERRGTGRITVFVVALVVALVAGLAGGAIGGWLGARNGGQGSLTDEDFSLGAAPRQASSRPPDSVAGIAQRVLPSVVSIKVSGPNIEGEGAGFAIKDGYVITNNHVAEAADQGGKLTLEFSNDKTANAEIVGRSPSYDIAVLKPQGVSGLPALSLGNSDNVVVGDSVIAIGSPLGLSGTVTSGIVSAVDRPVSAGGQGGEPTSYINAIQTDAAINQGNSGGPLVDSSGQVIGVNSAIATADSGPGIGGSQGGNIGIGFAIPINQAKRVAEQLIRTGEAPYPIIGAVIDLAYQGQGARIAPSATNGQQPIVSGGPAEEAGLQPGDVIVSFDGEQVSNAEELIVAIRSHAPGDEVKVTYQRGGDERTVTLTLDEAKE
ncbi:MAG: PDZ domain-containing protein [Streptosporangiales bacterium]|nr:PDZ domain-containing protein [Streptosporangiales bacterium]